MKTLKHYSEEIYKCSKCGLCQAVCPVFETTGLESAVSRGKFTLLNGVLNGKIKPDKNFSKYLDLCLGCNACYDFCPSGISAEEILAAAKYYNYQQNGMGFLKQFIILGFNSKFKLFILKMLLEIYKNTRFINLNNLFNSQLRENIKYKKLSPVKNNSDIKIVYFPGCVNNYINSSVKNSVLIVLEKNGFKIDIPKFFCCGIPARSAGDMDNFIKLAIENLNKIDVDIDYLLTDCASCSSVWKIYEDALDGKLKEKAGILAQKAVNINKFLMMSDIYLPENAAINKSVTYHDPCHLNRFQGISKEPRDILKMIPGLKLVEMQEADKCCGSAGTFCINYPDISKDISMKKALNIINTGAEIVSTSCPSCKIGILSGLMQYNRQLPVYQPVELLAKLYKK